MDVAQPPESIKAKVYASALVLAGAFATVSHEPPKHRYMFVDEALEKHPAQPIKVHGFVQPGSMLQLGTMNRFTLVHNGACLDTELMGTLPDTVRDTSELVVDGHLEQTNGHWVLVGTQLWAKCSANYGGAAPPNNSFK